ncbi:uncharacterized protein BX664DRAFT_341242 [Halteromyces radiatus]|uniref:uncharacterized protein n=1 Tax=Halteromyces radiatus TaxID=101107 RepID=UPI00221EBCE5|nr:uncharacterized protein BX664DRAFT_341242 [Halteromyces radiatus]KAI8081765.1 hypothetical protein BX664DRAFT_341242 [Halteromyces radiatus]
MALNRPEYREPKIPRAVVVYTIAQESRHIIIKNIPALSGEETTIQHLLSKCSLYGTVENSQSLNRIEEASPSFTLPPLLVTYSNIDEARLAKRKMDDKVFYANLLQVYYAPQYDTVEDLRVKFDKRRTAVTDTLWKINNSRRKKRDQKRQDDTTKMDWIGQTDLVWCEASQDDLGNSQEQLGVQLMGIPTGDTEKSSKIQFTTKRRRI